mmetsp:Transcript_27459/g.43238  ORF Transcript_27459/g.43238 Transcript_27459/m.43238 type:complete len:113 (+) Transcript_27459:309-647(+)
MSASPGGSITELIENLTPSEKEMSFSMSTSCMSTSTSNSNKCRSDDEELSDFCKSDAESGPAQESAQVKQEDDDKPEPGIDVLLAKDKDLMTPQELEKVRRERNRIHAKVGI